jgi:V8-like Glu-specific endopeptidase
MSRPRLKAASAVPLVAGIAVLASMAGSAAALAAGQPRAAGDAKRTVSQVTAYWTPKRMENAKPLDVVARPGGDTSRSGGTASPSSATVAYTSYELTDTYSFPNRVHGKVFFTRPGVGNFVCSGTVVDARNRATVITAGHCVLDAGRWSTNFAFAPGYGHLLGIANAPYGVWAASGEAAPQPWVDSQNLRFDVGAAVLARDVSGRSLQDVVGARGVAFNQTVSQSFRSYGYPAQPSSEHAFDGMALWACDSSPPVADNPTSASGPSTMGIGCDMTGGSSGGGWVTGAGRLNGLNSYRYTNQPDLMYGPYFGPTIKALYEYATTLPPGAAGSQAAGNTTPDASPVAVSDPAPPSAVPGCKKKPRKKKWRKRPAKRACKARR